MPPEELEEKLLSHRAYGEFVLPSYRDYCLSSVPSTVLSMFGARTRGPTIPRTELETGAQAEKVILFVTDGLGYRDVKSQFDDGSFFQAAASNDALIP